MEAVRLGARVPDGSGGHQLTSLWARGTGNPGQALGETYPPKSAPADRRGLPSWPACLAPSGCCPPAAAARCSGLCSKHADHAYGTAEFSLFASRKASRRPYLPQAAPWQSCHWAPALARAHKGSPSHHDPVETVSSPEEDLACRHDVTHLSTHAVPSIRPADVQRAGRSPGAQALGSVSTLMRASHFADHAAQRSQVQLRPAAEARVMIGLRSDRRRLCCIPATRLRRQKHRSVARRGREFVCRRTSARTAVVCSAEVNSLLPARQPKRR